MKSGKILFYALSKIHLQNMRVLEELCPEFEFVILQRSAFTWMSPENTPEYPNRRVMLGDGDAAPPELWEEKWGLIFLSIAYPAEFLLRLTHWAIVHGVAVVSLEEVSQLTLNCLRINHYMIPLDRLGVVSAYERDCFLSLGYPSGVLKVTGWPFWKRGGVLSRKGAGRGPRQKKVILAPLSSPRELELCSMERLEDQTRLLNIVLEAAGDEFQVFLKPHPNCTEDFVRKLVGTLRGEVTILGDICAGEALELCDFCVGRGSSMTLFEAVRRGIPVGVCPMGMETIFDRHLPAAVFDSPAGLKSLLAAPERVVSGYCRFSETHFPLTDSLSREEARRFLLDSLGTRPERSSWHFCNLALQLAFHGLRREALEIVGMAEDGSLRDSLLRLLGGEASYSDVECAERSGGVAAMQHASSLLFLLGGPPSKADVEAVLRNFMRAHNPHYFIHTLACLARDDDAGVRAWFLREYPGFLEEGARLS